MKLPNKKIKYFKRYDCLMICTNNWTTEELLHYNKVQKELENKSYLNNLTDKDIDLHNSQFDEKTDLELHIDEIE